MEQMFGAIRQMAKEAGRDPSTLELIVRANMNITEKPLGKDRHIFAGSLDQIKEDTQRCREIGASEVHFEPGFAGDITLDGWLKRMEELRRFV
jgi:hypothetical protein